MKLSDKIWEKVKNKQISITTDEDLSGYGYRITSKKDVIFKWVNIEYSKSSNKKYYYKDHETSKRKGRKNYVENQTRIQSQQRRYHEEHREENQERARIKYHENIEEEREKSHIYRETHLDEIKATSRKHYYKDHEKTKENKRAWYAKNKKKISEQWKIRYQGNPEKMKEKSREYREEHQEEINKRAREKYWEDPEETRRKSREYRHDHTEEIKLSAQKHEKENAIQRKKYWKSERGREKKRRNEAKRKRNLGFTIIAKFESEWKPAKTHYHHIDNENVIEIPATMHTKCSFRDVDHHRKAVRDMMQPILDKAYYDVLLPDKFEELKIKS